MLLLLAPVERDSHPHGDLVVKVLTLPSVPEYCYSFRMNESHTLPITRRRSPLHHTDQSSAVGVHGRCYAAAVNDL
jgi:hypothetical protein